jgi:hypothetical protein
MVLVRLIAVITDDDDDDICVKIVNQSSLMPRSRDTSAVSVASVEFPAHARTHARVA